MNNHIVVQFSDGRRRIIFIDHIVSVEEYNQGPVTILLSNGEKISAFNWDIDKLLSYLNGNKK